MTAAYTLPEPRLRRAHRPKKSPAATPARLNNILQQHTGRGADDDDEIIGRGAGVIAVERQRRIATGRRLAKIGHEQRFRDDITGADAALEVPDVVIRSGALIEDADLERVEPGAAIESIIDAVIAGVQRVVAIAAVEHVDANAAVEIVIALVAGNQIIGKAAKDQIVVEAARYQIDTIAAGQGVVAGITIEGVISCTKITNAAMYYISAITGFDDIGRGAPVIAIVAGAKIAVVVRRIRAPIDRVVAGSGLHNVDAVAAVEAVIAGVHRIEQLRQNVVTIAAKQCVVAGIADDDVDPCTRENPIIAVTTI